MCPSPSPPYLNPTSLWRTGNKRRKQLVRWANLMGRSQAVFDQKFEDDLRTENGVTFHHLPPEKLKELSRIDNFRGLQAICKTVLALVSIIATCCYLWHPLIIALGLVFIGSRQHAIFVLVHEAAHFRLFTSRALNDFVGTILGATIGISMHQYRVLHRLHHTYLYQRQDPDIPLHSGYPRGFFYLVKKLSRDLTGLTAYKTYAYFWALSSAAYFNQEISAGSIHIANADTTGYKLDRRLTILFHIGILSVVLTNGASSVYLVCWILPLLTVVPALLRLRAICEHGAVHDYSSPLTSARTNLGPKWLIWFFCPHNVNYHLEHHIYPSIPHYNLRACHSEMLKKGKIEGVEFPPIQETLKLVFSEPKTLEVRS
jgi:fatty acid desaturase